MLGVLYDKEYFYLNDFDKSRAEDGIALRENWLFSEYPELPEEAISILDNRPCSVLECLIALCERVWNDILYDPSSEETTSLLFQHAIHNLKLDYYDNDSINDGSIAEIDRIIGRWLDGKIKADGTGSPFIVRNPSKPMRGSDLWTQANMYVEDNF